MILKSLEQLLPLYKNKDCTRQALLANRVAIARHRINNRYDKLGLINHQMVFGNRRCMKMPTYYQSALMCSKNDAIDRDQAYVGEGAVGDPDWQAACTPPYGPFLSTPKSDTSGEES